MHYGSISTNQLTNHPVCVCVCRSEAIKWWCTQMVCNEYSRCFGETHSMGIMLLRSYHNNGERERANLICILGCDVAFFPSFTSIHFSYRCHFFCFSVVFFSILCDVWFFSRCCSKSKCVRNVYSLIETRTKKWKFSQYLLDDVWMSCHSKVDFDNKTRLIVFWCDAMQSAYWEHRCAFSRIQQILWVGYFGSFIQYCFSSE